MNDPSPYSSEYEREPEPDREAARRRVNVPAIGIIATAGLTALYHLVSAVLPFIGDFSEMYDQQQAMLEDFGMAFLATPLFSAGASAVGLAVSVVMLLGGLKMRALTGYGLAFTAAVLACIPCFTSCCCLITTPFGIWALIVLLDADVKRAFR